VFKDYRSGTGSYRRTDGLFIPERTGVAVNPSIYPKLTTPDYLYLAATCVSRFTFYIGNRSLNIIFPEKKA
jgi:hypothetical protein